MSDAEFPITFYHNPDCGTSRNALAMVRAAGYEPEVIEYRKTGWTRSLLQELMAAMRVGVRALLREKGTPAAELGLLGPDVTDAAILDAMIAHPILVNRPIVVTPKGAKLCRPSEVVLTLLERQLDSFTKEDGEVVRAPSSR
jgi:arsenate reductase